MIERLSASQTSQREVPRVKALHMPTEMQQTSRV